MRRRLFAWLWLGAALLAWPGASWAVCFSHPSVADEIKKSDLIVTARVIGSRDIVARDDPGGIDATIYTVRTRRSFKGRPSRILKIYSENTSARFPLDRDKDYLLFISRAPEGLVVDACGNSDELKRRLPLVRALHHGTAQRDHRRAPPDNSPD